ncbi:MAG TPA: efflux RND transporter periplasmic adaptor subunit [Phenylobacterium sp.]|jgi:HlyD family secretion protein|uniref:efflux RND transporter periplasmic adaptor subunit n=1 Tax=Phenylobacterium sp. TaxID=1871053 RepID=UPI002D5A376D|nr:efflux RND transporter periplasmic adaptor subunit [Phenylobacterium sp.]HZZ67770.1 efflux RND transporter periplasmic adaptor subunit [Phenylobacterium sp.]
MDTPIVLPWWRRRRTLVSAGVGAAVLAAAGLGAMALGGVKSSVRVPAQNVTLASVQPGVFHDFVALRATAQPKDVIYLDALEGGQVREVLAQAGDMVKAGQPLLTFRNTELELDVLDREGRLVESITQLQTYEKQLEDARVANEKAEAQIQYDITRLQRTAERRDSLVSKGFISKDLFEQVHDELDHNRKLLPLQTAANAEQDALRHRQIPQIQNELSTLQESLRVTRGKLDSLTVRAPVAGRLTDMDIKVGEIRNRGQRLGQIVADTGFKLQAQIDEFYLERVKPGETGSVTIEDRDVPVRVTRVDPQVKNATFQVDLAFDGAMPRGLLPGQALEGRLTLGGDRPALVLPAGAFLERSGGDWVMVVDASGTHADRRRVRLGRRSAEQVEVLAGLKAGERVITSDYNGFEKVDRVVLAK